jgi:Ras-related protein Rab-5C
VCKLQIWDTLGQEKYRCLNSAYYRGANAAIIVYDGSLAEDPLPRIQIWLKELYDYLPEDLPVWIVGNKSDLCKDNDRAGLDNEKSSNQFIKRFAKRNGFQFRMTSAKTGEEGLTEMFDSIATSLWPKLKKRHLDFME